VGRAERIIEDEAGENREQNIGRHDLVLEVAPVLGKEGVALVHRSAVGHTVIDSNHPLDARKAMTLAANIRAV